jgi:hypothetical protein
MNITVIKQAVLIYEHYNTETGGIFMNKPVLREAAFYEYSRKKRGGFFYQHYNTETGGFVL